MIELLTVTEKTSDDWKALRQRTVGSSDIASIAGLNRWKSALELWMEKSGKIEPKPDNDDLWLGRESESLTAKMFVRKNPDWVTDRAQVLCAHDDHEWATCTPDFWLTPRIEVEDLAQTVSEKRILETKFQKIHALDSWDEDVPTLHFIQGVWQLGVTGLPGLYLASLVGGFNYKQAFIEPRPDIFAGLIALASDFMELVRKDIPPTAGPGDVKLIKQLMPERDDVTLIPNETAQKWLMEWRTARDELQRLRNMEKDEERKKQAAENNIRMLMGGAVYGETQFITDGGLKIPVSISDKTTTRKAHHVAESSIKTFRVKFEESKE